jgi:hypothetical protein
MMIINEFEDITITIITNYPKINREQQNQRISELWYNFKQLQIFKTLNICVTEVIEREEKEGDTKYLRTNG